MFYGTKILVTGLHVKKIKNEYLQSSGPQITCCSMTTRAMAAWTTLVRSRQSMQLTRKIPSCLHITPA